jgi:small conductance mechanosensitive channel
MLQRGKEGDEPLLPLSKIAFERREQRANTMGSLLKSISTGAVFTVVAFMVVAELGYDIGPLIASAGILGVAIGFGAQSLVSDFLSGVFMILEDQYGVGDVVDVGEATGSVEAVGLRVTRLRDVNGTVWYVRNGEIMRVGNMSQNWARTVLDIPVAYGEDIGRIREILVDTAHQLYTDAEYSPVILEEPEVWGVERWDADSIVVRVVLKTAPLEQWNVARELRERIKDRFEELGIEIPFPQRVVWLRQGEPLVDVAARDEDHAPSTSDNTGESGSQRSG